jgi:hypothetical protein
LRWRSKQEIAGVPTNMDENHPDHLTGTEARAGTTPGVARVALIGGLVLVILAFAIIYFVAS